MKYRRMDDEITDEEVLLILRIVFPYARLKSYERHIGHNFITVNYLLPNDELTAERRIDFLPDDIYLVESDSRLPDGEPIKNGDILYRYIQYMVAKGYSEYWLDNPYV